jgi:hypothetical protein
MPDGVALREVADKRGLMQVRAASIGAMLAGVEGGAGLWTSMRVARAPAA